MKTITINVSDPMYRKFQKYAVAQDRTASELIREAMELYARERIEKRPSLRNSEPVSVAEVFHPFTGSADTLEEMLDDLRT